MDFSEPVNVLRDGQEFRSAAALDSRGSLYRRVGKRALDLTLALLLTPLLVLPILVLWVIVQRDGGSGFFAHMRVGRDGKMFRCWKIRTMVADSEERLADFLESDPKAAEEWARDHKLNDDPRVTKLGNVLRKTSLDELPQLWNVWRGDMTFVGPRPIVLDEMPKYGRHQSVYLAMKPGVTGLWQVSGRNDVTYDERVLMDVDYFERISLWLDLSLIAKTAAVVLRRTGK